MTSQIILGSAVAAAALAMLSTAVALVITKKKPGQAPPAMAFFPLVVLILGVIFILALALNMNERFDRPDSSVAAVPADTKPQPSIQLPANRPPAQTCVRRLTEKTDAGRHMISKDICVTGFSRVDELIASEVEKLETYFLAEIDEPSLAPLSNKFELFIKTDESSFGRLPEIQSVLITVDKNLGGAHPSQELRAWTFDRLTDRIVDFDLMFQPEHDPRMTLFALSKPQFLDVDYAENSEWDYRDFTVDGDELVFHFAPGIVAPHAAGAQSVRIPFADIQALLRPPFLNLDGTYVGEKPPAAPNYGAECTKAGGNWLNAYSECEYVGQDWCEQQMGRFLECESACRHDAAAELCTLQCVPVCKL